MIKAVARGIPADVTVRLRKVPVTVTVRDAIFLTFAYAFFAFSVRSDNRSPIIGKGEIILMDKTLFHGDIQKFFSIDFKERSVRLVVDGKRCFFQLWQKGSNGYFFNRSGFFTFGMWLFHFCFHRMDMRGHMGIIRIP